MNDHDSAEPTENPNPFQAHIVDDPPPVNSSDAPFVPPPVDPNRRVWTACVIPIAGIAAALSVSVVAFGILMAVYSNGDFTPDRLPDVMEKIVSSTGGLLGVILPGQIAFMAVAIFAAALSPIAFRERLGLTKGTMPIWTWFVMGLASPLVGVTSGFLIESSGVEMSENLKMMGKMFTAESGPKLALIALLVGILPAVAEELLFRGYMLTRLWRNWPPAIAIGLSALVFAIAHMDPVHSLGVLPLGLWLGFISWKSKSIFPAMLGHAANNLFAVFATQSEAESAMDSPPMLAFIVLSAAAMLATIAIVFLRTSDGLPQVAEASMDSTEY